MQTLTLVVRSWSGLGYGRAVLSASVIIDTYNQERFIREAIDSALSQSYRHTEVIVVDDGSTDGTPELIAAYGDRIRAVLKDNGGQGSALNAGFAASQGDVVVFLDGDDVLLEGALESIAPHFADPDVAKVHWSMPRIDAAGHLTGDIEEPELSGGDFREDVRREGPLSDAALPSAPTSGNAWSRWFLERVMPMSEDKFAYGADTYLFGLAPAFGRIVLLEQPQSLYRVHGSNLHATVNFAQMLAFEVLSIEALQPIVADAYREAGIEVDVDGWQRGPWFARVNLAVQAILGLVPAGECFLLADEDAWGTDADFFGRRRVPFPQRDGEYSGLPEDDAAAIAELERWRAGGAVAIFFPWDTHWWLEHFPALARHLELRYRCRRRDDLLIAFDLHD
jgi:glycosyltransferase involved in cell wall biosynthesis